MRITNINIMPNFKCNFSCSYCNLQKISTDELSWEDLIPFINFIDKNNTVKNIGIQFEGGETLLSWKTFIQPLVEYITQHTSLQPSYSLFSNCSIYTDELFEFLQKYDFQMVLSVDGDYEVFQLRNANLFNTVKANLQKYCILPKTTINAVFLPTTVKFLYNSFVFLVQNGAKHIGFTPDNRVNTIWSQEELLEIKKQFLQIIENDPEHKLIFPDAICNTEKRQKNRLNEHNQKIRIFPNGDIVFNSDPFLRNVKKHSNCTIYDFNTLFQDNDKQIEDIHAFGLINTKENCDKCLSKFLCAPTVYQEGDILTSPALCSMRVAFLMGDRLADVG